MSGAQLLDLAQAAVDCARKAGATAADAVGVYSQDIGCSVRNGTPEDIERSESSVIGLRVFDGTRVASTSATDISLKSIQEMAERAVTMARLAPEDEFAGLADASRLLHGTPADLELHDRSPAPSTEQLQNWCRELEDSALSVEGITNSEGGSAGYGTSHVALVTSHGFAQCYQSSHWSRSISVLAGKDTGMERDYDYSTTHHLADLKSCEAIGKEAARRTLRRMNPRKINTCSVPVLMEPRIARSLLSSLSGAVSGAAIAKGTSFLKDALDTLVFPEAITITDDPLRLRGLSSRPFDGEGVKTAPLTLIDKGRLTSWIMDTRSAKKLGLATTGHATRSVSGGPTPHTTNLTLLPGTRSPEAMIAEIKQGLLVTETFGMGINLITGDFSQGAAGYWIENGELAYPVSEITIAGHLKTMFANLEAANDLEYLSSTNSPTVSVGTMSVAGA